MRIASGLSTLEDTPGAFAEAAGQATAGLGGAAADLALVFCGPSHLEGASEGLEAARERLGPGSLVGCGAEAVIGTGRELERGSGAAVWAAALGQGAEVEAFHMVARRTEEGIGIAGVPEPLDGRALILLADPYTFPAEALLGHLRRHGPALPIVGGNASGADAPGGQVLFLDGDVLHEGAVGVRLDGVDVRAGVSQGAAPVGPELVVTASEGNRIVELASMPALERLQEVIAGLDSREQLLIATGLLLGVVIDENRPEYGRGNFLVRGVLGVDSDSGALVIGDQVRVGQTVRFHVRDAESADEDLRLELEQQLAGLGGRTPAGALLFTCNGRGTRMFAGPDHDAGMVAELFGSVPTAGVFCAGEIGPVGGRNFLHGFTATLAVFVDGES